MDNKKDNAYYVKKIVTDLAFIIEHTRGLTQQELEWSVPLYKVFVSFSSTFPYVFNTIMIEDGRVSVNGDWTLFRKIL